MTSLEGILIGAGLLVLLSILASKASARFGVPALLLFLVIGMLAGSDGPGGVYFDDYRAAQNIGIVALVFILFSGGMETDWDKVRPVLFQGLGLSTVGVALTSLLVGLAARFFLDFTWYEALLLGAIVSSTDAAAVFSVLRSKNVGLKGHLKPLLEFESGSNDPMAVFLTLGFIHLLQHPEQSLWNLFPMFLQQMTLGGGLGWLFGRGAVAILRRLRLEYEGLYPVFSLAWVLVAYAVTSALEGSGFLAVYMVGLVLAKHPFPQRKTLRQFHDGLAWLMQIAMFLVLGLLAFPSQLVLSIPQGLVLSVVLILVARPLSVFLTLAPTRIGFREKLLISWVGLKGAAPIILATFPLVADTPRDDLIFNLVFFTVLTSVLLQGTTIPLVARWLKVDAPLKSPRHYPLEFEDAAGETDLEEIIVPYHSPLVGKTLARLGLPSDCLVTLVCREERFLLPEGSTVLEGGDVLLTLVHRRSKERVRQIFD